MNKFLEDLPEDLIKRYQLDQIPDEIVSQHRLLVLRVVQIEMDEGLDSPTALWRINELRSMFLRLEVSYKGLEYVRTYLMSHILLGEE